MQMPPLGKIHNGRSPAFSKRFETSGIKIQKDAELLPIRSSGHGSEFLKGCEFTFRGSAKLGSFLEGKICCEPRFGNDIADVIFELCHG